MIKPFIIIGLGNPEEIYEHTPHNIGRDFLIFSALKHADSPWKADRLSNALVTQGQINEKQIIYALPNTYMNNSGRSVKSLLGKFRSGIKHCLIVHDDSDLALGNVKLATASRSAGHHGIDSIFSVLKTKEIYRIRIGIRPPDQKSRAGAFVLRKFSQKQIINLETETYPKVEALINNILGGADSLKTQHKKKD